MLRPEQRRQLLTIARTTIASALDGSPRRWTPAEVDDDLRKPSGAFVTLDQRDGSLRGCIGSIQPVEPLFQAVALNALAAAFRDPRFSPVSREELDALHVEISVMGPVEPLRNVEEIEVGRDGLIVRMGRSAGLLLPQVATEYGWDRLTFLRQTCVKAGLPPDAWRDPNASIEKFSAEVFGE